MTAPTAVAVCENVASTSADIVGKDAAKGTCHKCGGSLSRGNPELAKLCGTCGTRFHASDCGKRLAQVGFPYAGHLCPKVRDLLRIPHAPPRPRPYSHPTPGTRSRSSSELRVAGRSVRSHDAFARVLNAARARCARETRRETRVGERQPALWMHANATRGGTRVSVVDLGTHRGANRPPGRWFLSTFALSVFFRASREGKGTECHDLEPPRSIAHRPNAFPFPSVTACASAAAARACATPPTCE